MNEQKPQVGLEEINEKLDRLLAYERARLIWGVLKTVTAIIIFLIFVIVPTYLLYELLRNPFEFIDISQIPPEIKQMIQEFITNRP